MAFCLEPFEPLDAAARRIVREQLDGALLDLAAPEAERDAAVHSFRKRMKRLRAVLRLLRPELGEQVYRQENACFRNAARELAAAREAAAVLGSFDGLVRRARGDIAPAAFGALREILVESRRRATAGGEGLPVQRVGEQLEAARERLEHWPLTHAGWKTISPGFEATYARGRKAHRTAWAEPTTEALHTLRKFVKHHFYQVQILEPLWPAQLGTRRGLLKDLSELLGDDHDLADLRATLVSGPLQASVDPALGPLLSRLEARRNELRGHAHALSLRLYAERPRAIQRRFRGFYRAWRDEPASPTAEKPEPPARVQRPAEPLGVDRPS